MNTLLPLWQAWPHSTELSGKRARGGRRSASRRGAPSSGTNPSCGQGAARLWPTPRDGLNYATGWNHCEWHWQYKIFPMWETRLRCNHPWQACLSRGIQQGHKCVDGVVEVVGQSATNILAEQAIGVSPSYVAQRAVRGRTAGYIHTKRMSSGPQEGWSP